MTQASTQVGLQAIYERYAEAWAIRDPDLIATLHTPETTFWLRNGEAPVTGRAAVRDAFAGFFAQWPNFGFDVHRVLFGPEHWILDWALTAELTDAVGSRRPVRFDCLDVVVVHDNGLVLRKDTFIDHAQALAAVNGLEAG